MNIKRFFGKNSREALHLVRQAIGENAIIISNRAVEGGNEIMAVSEQEMHAATQTYSPQADVYKASEPTYYKPQQELKQEEPKQAPTYTDESNAFSETLDFDNAPTLLSILTQSKSRELEQKVNEVTEAKKPISHHVEPESDLSLFNFHVKEQVNLNAASNEMSNFMQQEINDKINEMLAEMRGMRNQVSSQMNAISWNNQLQNNPVKSKIISTLLTAKFSAALSRKIAEKLPNTLNHASAHAWIKEVLCKHIDTVDSEDSLFEQGGVYALVGPTGVGKTTTTAKLAARYVMKYGTQNLGLITTDGYRIGGHEQLRIYGKILGVMVHAVKDEDDLKIALQELKNKHMILIDTVGISQRDQMVTEQISMLANTNVPIQKLLCLNATCSGETLSDVVNTYKGRALDGCIITKLDEAASYGGVLDVVIRERVKLFYTTHGQRVPEDISVADKETLISKALMLDANSWPYQYLEEELPFVVANTTPPYSAENGSDKESSHV
jgi:flagellar biosynthesis protein FlhF